jgi:hypothetical protein
MSSIKITPSILSADFSQLGNEIKNLKTNLIKWYSKILPSFDKNKDLILNYSAQNLRKLRLLTDKDLVKYFKINLGSPQKGKKIVRSLRKIGGLIFIVIQDKKEIHHYVLKFLMQKNLKINLEHL